MKFGDRLKELRIKRGLNQEQLAQQLGISSSSISMYERNQREPNFETEEMFADFFNVDLNYLRGNQNTTTKIISGDASLLLHIYQELDEIGKAQLMSYAKGMLDLEIARKNGKV